MKKEFTIAFTALVLSANSQVTVTQSDIVTPGKSFVQGSDSVFTGIIGKGGANLTWDYTSTFTEDGTDTLHVLDPNNVALSSNYPGSTLVFATKNQTNFFKSSSADLSAMGSASDPSTLGLSGLPNNMMLLHYNPAEIFIKLPASYNGTFKGTSKADVRLPSFGQFVAYADSMRVLITRANTSTYDAWGQLTTPYGTYSVLREKTSTTHTDTISVKLKGSSTWMQITVDVTGIDSYKYWANNIGLPILEIDSVTKAGQYTQSTIGKKNAGATKKVMVGIKENNSFSHLKVYPNPASDYITLKFENNFEPNTIEIYNAIGALMLTTVSHDANTTVDLSSLANGAYYYKIRGKNSQEKFIISK